MAFLKAVTSLNGQQKVPCIEPVATINNTNIYRSNQIKHVLNKTKTPKQPRTFVEDIKIGPWTKKKLGLIIIVEAPQFFPRKGPVSI